MRDRCVAHSPERQSGWVRDEALAPLAPGGPEVILFCGTTTFPSVPASHDLPHCLPACRPALSQ